MSNELSDRERRALQKAAMMQKFAKTRKNHTIAVLLCIFAGFLGAHRWYVGHKVAAIIIAIIGIFLITNNYLYFVQLDKIYLEDWLALLRAYGIFVAIESFLIFRTVDKKNAIMRESLEAEYNL